MFYYNRHTLNMWNDAFFLLMHGRTVQDLMSFDSVIRTYKKNACNEFHIVCLSFKEKNEMTRCFKTVSMSHLVGVVFI